MSASLSCTPWLLGRPCWVGEKLSAVIKTLMEQREIKKFVNERWHMFEFLHSPRLVFDGVDAMQRNGVKIEIG